MDGGLVPSEMHKRKQNTTYRLAFFVFVFFCGLAAESSPMIAVVAYGLVTVREAPQRTIETQRVVNGIAAQRSTQNRWLIPVWIRSEKAQTQTIYIYGVFALKVLPR